MKRMFLFLASLVLAASAMAQTNQPRPKSQEEVEAIMAMQKAQTPDQRIEAAKSLLENFKDTEFKETAYFFLMLSYQQKNDFENMMIWGEQTLEENPDNVGALLSMALAIPTRTREHDLDRDEKLARAEDLAERALALIPNLNKPNPDIPDDQWLAQKKDYMSQGNESLGLIHLKRKNYAEAEEYFQKAAEMAAQPNSMLYFRLAQSLRHQAKYDEALSQVQKSIELGGVPMGGGRNASELLKAEIETAKEKGLPPTKELEKGKQEDAGVELETVDVQQ